MYLQVLFHDKMALSAFNLPLCFFCLKIIIKLQQDEDTLCVIIGSHTCIWANTTHLCCLLLSVHGMEVDLQKNHELPNWNDMGGNCKIWLTLDNNHTLLLTCCAFVKHWQLAFAQTSIYTCVVITPKMGLFPNCSLHNICVNFIRFYPCTSRNRGSLYHPYMAINASPASMNSLMQTARTNQQRTPKSESV